MTSFQVKIVGDSCNLRCTYCRNRDFNQKDINIMSIEKLEKFFKFLSSSPHQKIYLNWHGGEPLLAGKDFFKDILIFEKIYPEKIWVNSIQTNATLIDNEWAKFFADNNFHIGISIDGSERTHNINRLNIVGHGTYKNVLNNVKILRGHGIYPSTICTITKKTAIYAEEILLELVKNDFKGIAFNVFYNTVSEDEGDEDSLSDKEWLSFLIKIFETWLSLNDSSIRIREIDSILAWTKLKLANCCVYKGTCHQWFVVDFNGDIYPCERFGRVTSFGSIDSMKTTEDLIKNTDFLEHKRITESLPQQCVVCNFKSLCHNGCSKHRKIQTDDLPLYIYCKSRIEFYNYIQNTLKNRKEVYYG